MCSCLEGYIHGHLLTRSRINSPLFQRGFNAATVEFCNLIGRTAWAPLPPPPLPLRFYLLLLWKIDAFVVRVSRSYFPSRVLSAREKDWTGRGGGGSRFGIFMKFRRLRYASRSLRGVIGVRYRYRDTDEEHYSSNTSSV